MVIVEFVADQRKYMFIIVFNSMTDFVADVWWFEMKLRHIVSQIVYPQQQFRASE
jgi:translation elongation factor EF-Ts